MLEEAPFALDLSSSPDQYQRDFGAHDLVPADDLEVDVGEGVAHRVPLELASQHQMSRTVYVQGQHLVQAPWTERAVRRSRPTTETGSGFMPCPYTTAGTRPS